MSNIRFVILHHRQSDGEHWDLMIEQCDCLATWQLWLDPIRHMGDAVPATRIGDHRKDYLTYEGPVSGDRGEVARVEEGACEIMHADESSWRVRLSGQRIRGEFHLSTDSTGQWTMRADRPGTDPAGQALGRE